MTQKKTIPFFTELGILLNLIRSISSALNEETSESAENKQGTGNIRYMTGGPAGRLQANLKKLESEVAFFFTGAGARKATDSGFDTLIIKQHFIPAFKVLSNEYFSIMSARKNKASFRQNTEVSFTSEVYKLTSRQPAVVN